MAQAKVTVGAIRERPGFDPAGDLITFVDVPFRIEATGDSGIVSIPAPQFSAARAQEEITLRVAELTALRGMVEGA